MLENPEVEPGPWVRRVDLERAAVRSLGLLVFLQSALGHTQSQVCVRIAGDFARSQGEIERSLRDFVVAKAEREETQVHVGVRVFVLDLQRLFEELDRAGLIDQPLSFLLYSRFAVIVALVHIFLPYVVLVLYAGMGPLGDGMLEVAQDLGAKSSLLWRRVIIPIMAAPAFSAFVFVFILSAADYVTPQFLGGKDGVTLGVQIQQNFIGVGNWPLAAATSFLMLLAFVAVFAVGSFILRRLKLNDIRLSS